MLHLQHNIVSVLYTIKGVVETHMSRFEEGSFGEGTTALTDAHESLKKIYLRAERALLIAKKIGFVMRASSQVEGPMDQVSIGAVWDEAVEIVRRRHSFNALEIINHIPQDFPRILCRRKDLREIFFCLADNAIQAMEGRGKLVVRVSLAFRTEDDPIATITVADTGPGIPEETLNRLFEPFMTTKSPGEGNGLGLCLVKGLVRKNRGGISVSSYRGSGTTFTLAFSVAKTKDRETEKDYALTGQG